MHPVVEAASTQFFSFTNAITRDIQYARITVDALKLFEDRDWSADIKSVDMSSNESLLALANAFVLKQDVGFLKDQKERTEALIHAQTVNTMWSTLEAHIDDLLISVMSVEAAFLQTEEVKKVKVSLGEYHAFQDDDERLDYLLDQVKLALKSKLARGPAVFERLLAAFQLSGPIEDSVSRELVEFSAVRNCVTHRRGIADRRFMEASPATKFKVGESIVVTKRQAGRYYFAAQQYACTVFARLTQKYEPELKIPSDHAARLLKLLDEERAKGDV